MNLITSKYLTLVITFFFSFLFFFFFLNKCFGDLNRFVCSVIMLSSFDHHFHVIQPCHCTNCLPLAVHHQTDLLTSLEHWTKLVISHTHIHSCLCVLSMGEELAIYDSPHGIHVLLFIYFILLIMN